MMFFIDIVMSLVMLTMLIGMWIVGCYLVDDAFFGGHFRKKLRARFGVEE